MATQSAHPDAASLDDFVSRFREKLFDWNAFPRSKGHPTLQRGQMRHIGAGGSPKVHDPDTLPPTHFTLSIINLPPGHFGAAHYHDDCEEIFLGLDGCTTVGFVFDDEVIELTLGPKDLLMLPPHLPHGYRNDSLEPTRFSVMVGAGRPNLPIYTAHPTQSARALAFGAAPGKTLRYSARSGDPRMHALRANLVRYAEQPVHRHPAGFAWKTYVGRGAAPAGNFREDLIHLPAGVGVAPYERSVEDAYYVLEGELTVGWEIDGAVVERRLGVRDVVLTPPGRRHYFRNDGFRDAEFMMVVGTREPEDVAFRAA